MIVPNEMFRLGRADAGSRTVGEHTVEGVAFRQAEFAADDFVACADIADDVDAVDVYAWPLLDRIGDIDGTVRDVAGDDRANIDEHEAARAGGEGQRFDRAVDQIGVVNLILNRKQ